MTCESSPQTLGKHWMKKIKHLFIGSFVAEAEAPILWPLDAKSQLIEKDPDAGKD